MGTAGVGGYYLPQTGGEQAGGSMWPYAAMAGASALGGYLQGQGQQQAAGADRQLTREQMALEEARRRQAQGYLQGYSYTPYAQGGGQGASVMSSFLRGQLPIGQQAVINQQRDLGMSAIGTRAAGMGMPSGGRSALSVQLNRDLALGAGQMAGQQQQLGLGYSMQDYLAAQNADWQKRLAQAQYAPGGGY